MDKLELTPIPFASLTPQNYVPRKLKMKWTPDLEKGFCEEMGWTPSDWIHYKEGTYQLVVGDRWFKWR